MIIIFDTFGGLCNQFYDINCGINFCIINNIKFSFRYCSFRNENLISWYEKKIEMLFNTDILKKKTDFDDLNITSENTFNYDNKNAISIFSENYFNEIINCNKDYIILKQFWSIYKFSKIIVDLNSQILPSKRIIDIYNNIKNKILCADEKYNYIHYRYEIDFTSHFGVKIENINDLILRLQKSFKNPNLKIYIATFNIDDLIDENNKINNIIIKKDPSDIANLNYEEMAFIDYLFGLNSNEIYGHSKSSFSHMLNNLKGTNNFYD